MPNLSPTVKIRVILTLVGLLAGLGGYNLFATDVFEGAERLHLFVGALWGIGFTAILVMAGAVPLRRSVPYAVVIGAVAAGLLTWGSLRFVEVEEYLETVMPFFAFLIVGLLPIPFVMAREVDGSFWNYQGLFTHSWDVIVRVASGGVFVGLMWLAFGLANHLLVTVQLTFLGQFMNLPAVPWLISGAAVGLSAAILNELSEVLSAALVLRLLRVFILPALVIVGLFALFLPINGLSGAPLGSAATTALLAAIVATTLVSIGLDCGAELAVHSPLMRNAVRLLAVFVVILAGVASYALWLRIDQHGFSPARIYAAVASMIALAYGACYAVSVVRRGDWMARIRRTNTVMAPVVGVLAALTLTPVINPEAISTRDKVARIIAAGEDPDWAELFDMRNDWGVAGRAALDQLAALDHPEISPSVRNYLLNDKSARPTTEVFTREMFEAIPRYGFAADYAPTEDEFSKFIGGTFEYVRRETSRACKRSTPAGHAGCLITRVWRQDESIRFVDVLVQWDGDDVSAIEISSAGLESVSELMVSVNTRTTVSDPTGDLFDQYIQAGAGAVPLTYQGIKVGDKVIQTIP
ncbi:MAG: hypothetical protein VXY73_10695 [Pseudomonadota bacterium]|nr:hypothetical protein [Pseudomonadota bacterium]